MNHHYEEEDLFQSVEDSYLSMVSALALGLHLKRFGESYVYPNLGNIKLSSGQYITKEVQLHALRKNPLTKFSISCALRGVFSAMYEVIKNTIFSQLSG